MTILNPIIKTDEDLRLVFGWANVTVYDGEEEVDTQGDIIESQTLVKAFMDFMSNCRVGGLMHLRDSDGNAVGIGEVVFAFPFTPDIKKALKIYIPEEGVVIGLRADHDEVWKAVKEGKLAAFSIAGTALREPEDGDGE